MIPEKVKKLMTKDRIIYIATASKEGVPNLVAAEFCGLYDNKMLVADCHFDKTFKNLKENPKTSILLTDEESYFQIKGECEYLTEGEYFDIVKKICEGTEYSPKGAVLFSCDEIYDLNTYEKLK